VVADGVRREDEGLGDTKAAAEFGIEITGPPRIPAWPPSTRGARGRKLRQRCAIDYCRSARILRAEN
jgi:hypothetical protein